MFMLVTFEVLEENGELTAVHDGALGLLVAFGYDWDMLRDMVNESVASVIDDTTQVEIELFIDEYHITRFKHSYDPMVAERIKRRLEGS
jgi:hypothetical protein